MNHSKSDDDNAFNKLISEAGKIGYPVAERGGKSVRFSNADQQRLQIQVRCPHCRKAYTFDVLKLMLYYVSGVLCTVCPSCRTPIQNDVEGSPFVAMQSRLLTLKMNMPYLSAKLKVLYPEYEWEVSQSPSNTN